MDPDELLAPRLVAAKLQMAILVESHMVGYSFIVMLGPSHFMWMNLGTS